jgi:hypothetical protein
MSQVQYTREILKAISALVKDMADSIEGSDRVHYKNAYHNIDAAVYELGMLGLGNIPLPNTPRVVISTDDSNIGDTGIKYPNQVVATGVFMIVDEVRGFKYGPFINPTRHNMVEAAQAHIDAGDHHHIYLEGWRVDMHTGRIHLLLGS